MVFLVQMETHLDLVVALDDDAFRFVYSYLYYSYLIGDARCRKQSPWKKKLQELLHHLDLCSVVAAFASDAAVVAACSSCGSFSPWLLSINLLVLLTKGLGRKNRNRSI